MRKESLKKNSTNGVVEDGSIDNNADLNGAVDEVDADPLQGADQPLLEIPKKKGRGKKVETVTIMEVALPTNNDNDDDREYEVEDIINHKFEKKSRLFLVRWKDCGPDEDTWEPESSLACPEIIAKYIENNPEAEKSAGSRKRPATKEKSATSAVPAKRSRSKNPTSTTTDNDSNADDDAANGEEEYEVEAIVKHKTERGKTSFLIRWKNYDSSGDTWEPESSLSCPEIISKYKEEHMKDVTSKPKREAKPKKEKSEKEYEVQCIYDEKIENGVKHYLVRWKGYKMDDNTWEPEDSLNCPEVISKYIEAKKNKRTSGVRGTSKKLTYTEVEETEGEDAKSVYVNGGSSSRSKSKTKSKPSKGKKSSKNPKQQKEEDYEVEDIVGEKMEKGKKYYLMKWKGWPSSDNTWELASSLQCPDILKKYNSNRLETDTASAKSPKAAKSPSGKKSKAAAKKATKSKAAKKLKSPAKSKSPATTPKTKAARKQKPESDDDDKEQEWEVEKIIDVRYNEDGTKNFLIRWKGCDPTQDTWEPENNVQSPDLVEEFMSKADGADDVSAPKKKSRKA